MARHQSGGDRRSYYDQRDENTDRPPLTTQPASFSDERFGIHRDRRFECDTSVLNGVHVAHYEMLVIIAASSSGR
jgi:hypothetical protein